MKSQFKTAYSQIRSGKKIEDFWGEGIPYSILRAAKESTSAPAEVCLETRLANYKAGKALFGWAK